MPPNHHQARTRVTHTLFLHVTISIVAASTTAAAAAAAAAGPQETNAKEKQRGTCGTMQYHARKRTDTNRGEHVLEQEESKNHRDTATTAVTATNRHNARERKRDMLAHTQVMGSDAKTARTQRRAAEGDEYRGSTHSI